MYQKDLGQGYHLKEVTVEELNPVLDQYFDKVFGNRTNTAIEAPQDLETKNKITERRRTEQRYRLRVVIYSGSQVVGWHYGYSSDPETYYMQNSAILPQYQNKKIYSLFLESLLEKIKEDGFQVVTSTHHPNNAAVLIPKLKKGFVISSMLIHERFRFLVELKYFFNESRRKSFANNIGLNL